MLVELYPFQQRAVRDLRKTTANAHKYYSATNCPQIISFTAPTGSGKTIIMSSLIENILFGTEEFIDQRDAIIVWLSDSPQLNEQSKQKINNKADKIKIGQCITIEDESFNHRILEDGNIYFLNTQKIGKSGNLTKHSDNRQYTIWETLENTIEEKSDRLYFIIDEAHRGTTGNEAGRATSIMQKFIKGSKADGMRPMPVVIGMSATTERFNKLADNTTSTVQKVIVTANEVRSSGLLKDRIIITYPEDSEVHNDMAILQAATDEWVDKSKHWYQYTYEQHYQNVNPIFVIQVENGSADCVTKTNLSDCLAKIEERIGYKFKENEVVHSFGQTGTLSINGLEIPHVDASEIADNRRIRVVFFKENLSTGWDCPRAETMMSFRKADDSTYIAQLLGRMIRTPLQMRVKVDESLNDVHLFLPYYNANTVSKIVDDLQSAEGGDIPTVIDEESVENPNYTTWTVRPKSNSRHQSLDGNQINIFNYGDDTTPEEIFGGQLDVPYNPAIPERLSVSGENEDPGATLADTGRKTTNPDEEAVPEPHLDIPTGTQIEIKGYTLNREEVIKFINSLGILTYEVKNITIHEYLPSLLAMARLLSQAGISTEPLLEIKADMCKMIHAYSEQLKLAGKYDEYADNVLKFKLASKVYDPFGDVIEDYNILDILASSDEDLDRQTRQADRLLGQFGICFEYGRLYYDDNYPNAFKIDTVLFAADNTCMQQLRSYAKDKFHKLDDEYRRLLLTSTERYQKQYNDIVSDADIVSKHNFKIPETISVRMDEDGTEFTDHLFVDEETGIAKIKLNTWEEGVIREEEKNPKFVCWIRNPSRGSWALTFPRDENGVKKPAYPDFIVIRSDEHTGYVVDILEPHSGALSDNLSKAKGLAEYARQNPLVGRVQLIRGDKDALKNNTYRRLDMAKSSTREKVLSATTNDELDHLFETDGFYGFE